MLFHFAYLLTQPAPGRHFIFFLSSSSMKSHDVPVLRLGPIPSSCTLIVQTLFDWTKGLSAGPLGETGSCRMATWPTSSLMLARALAAQHGIGFTVIYNTVASQR